MKKKTVKSYIDGGLIQGVKLGIQGQYENSNDAEIVAPLVKLKSILHTNPIK